MIYWLAFLLEFLSTKYFSIDSVDTEQVEVIGDGQEQPAIRSEDARKLMQRNLGVRNMLNCFARNYSVKMPFIPWHCLNIANIPLDIGQLPTARK